MDIHVAHHLLSPKMCAGQPSPRVTHGCLCRTRPEVDNRSSALCVDICLPFFHNNILITVLALPHFRMRHTGQSSVPRPVRSWESATQTWGGLTMGRRLVVVVVVAGTQLTNCTSLVWVGPSRMVRRLLQQQRRPTILCSSSSNRASGRGMMAGGCWMA